MVKLLLSIKAELENVTDLAPASDDFDYHFKVKCNSCHETHEKFVTMSKSDGTKARSGKGTEADFVWRCDFCKRESSASFEPNTTPLPYKAEANGDFSPLLTLDCRGLEFVGFRHTESAWKCVGVESGTPFPEVDLSDDYWSDYDEKASQAVSVSGFESKWSRAP
ncbi:DUF866-domain-containing protein [Schizopora paradoxa]|uniref:DUF866-domain-containing protein n=1 Tax=Schizopora paradoxa TaxID=27342 RepID=A0A0H2RSD5_9AGAM|nr:DUF866-domain-containing protein [Schizopora paradoxa]